MSNLCDGSVKFQRRDCKVSAAQGVKRRRHIQRWLFWKNCALYIARRLGFAPHMLERAKTAAELPKRKAEPVTAFALGDSVEVGTDGELGLVFKPADEKGMVGVQSKGVKSYVNHKRLTLKTPASELYPPDYDFSIIFDSVENRKACHLMDKKFVPGLTITIEEP